MGAFFKKHPCVLRPHITAYALPVLFLFLSCEREKEPKREDALSRQGAFRALRSATRGAAPRPRKPLKRLDPNLKKEHGNVLCAVPFIKTFFKVFAGMGAFFKKHPSVLRSPRLSFANFRRNLALYDSINPLSLSRSSMSVPCTFLRRSFIISLSLKESLMLVIGCLSMA